LGSAATAPDLRRAIERHYDSLAFLYRVFWGEHIHHGLWPSRGGSPLDAQIRLVSHLADRAAVERGERVLDVGCGYGAPARWLSSYLDCEVISITISEKQARHAHRVNGRAGQSRSIAVIRADAATLPIADESVDVVWVVECLEHLADKQRFINDVARVLKTGGRLGLCTWQDGDKEQGLVDEVCDRFLCHSLATEDELQSWSEAAGLTVRVSEDLTSDVKRTWDILTRRVGHFWLRPLRLLASRELLSFVDGFPVIAKAYETGAMKYGLLVSQKA
jgi:tocopherol O-methyltransferase